MLRVLQDTLLQLASEFREELVAGRGRVWLSKDGEQQELEWQPICGEEVREAMRLDIPSPLGARILLVDSCSSFLRSPFSSTSMFLCWWGEVHSDAGRPTVENWPGRTSEIDGDFGRALSGIPVTVLRRLNFRGRRFSESALESVLRKLAWRSKLSP